MRELVSHCTTIDETEPQRTAALADAIISAVGAEHVDKFGEFTPPLSDRDPMAFSRSLLIPLPFSLHCNGV